MASTTVGQILLKLNADPGGLINGFSTAQRQAKTLAGTFRQVQSELQKTQSAGREITLSVRTPREAFAATREQLTRLRDDGAITGQTFERAMSQARQSLRATDPAFQAATRRINEMRARASEIRLDVRTPREIFGATMAELRRLREQGMISMETLGRSADAARAKLLSVGLEGVAPIISRLRQMAAVGVASFAGFVGWGIKLAGEAQKAEASFTILTGSAAGGRAMVASLRQIAEQAPSLSFDSLSQATRTMLQFGVATEQVAPMLRAFGDITGGDAQRLEMLSLSFAQMSAAGRLMGQDLLQMINAGFNPLQQISKMTGESLVDLKKKMESGAISSQQVTEAFKSATAEGGRFFGNLAAQSETLPGKFAALQNSTRNLARSIGETLVPAVLRIIEAIRPWGDAMQSLDSRIVAVGLGTVAFVAGMAGIVSAASAVSRTIAAMTAAYQALAAAQAFTLALSGPKGWLILAGAAAAATAAVAAYAAVQKAAGDKAAKAAKDKAADAEAMKNIGNAAKAATKATSDLAAITDEQFKKASEATRKFSEDMSALEDQMKRGEQIRLEFRTPEAKYMDAIRDLESLRQVGAITGNVMMLAAAKAGDEYIAATDKVKGLKNELQGVAALDIRTTAAFSELQKLGREDRAAKQADAEQRRADEKLAKLFEQALGVQQQTARNTDEIARNSRRPAIEVKEVDL